MAEGFSQRFGQFMVNTNHIFSKQTKSFRCILWERLLSSLDLFTVSLWRYSKQQNFSRKFRSPGSKVVWWVISHTFVCLQLVAHALDSVLVSHCMPIGVHDSWVGLHHCVWHHLLALQCPSDLHLYSTLVWLLVLTCTTEANAELNIFITKTIWEANRPYFAADEKLNCSPELSWRSKGFFKHNNNLYPHRYPFIPLGEKKKL